MSDDNSAGFELASAAAGQVELTNWLMFQRPSFVPYNQWNPGVQDLAGFDESDTGRKSAFALHVARALDGLGLGNLCEPESLFVERAHCFSAEEVARMLPELSCPLDPESFGKLGFGMLDPNLVRKYIASEATELGMGESGSSVAASMKPPAVPGVLFDPLYGMAILRDGSGWRGVNFAGNLWRDRAAKQPPERIKQFLAAYIPTALSDGAFLARNWFNDLLPVVAHTDDLQQVPEITVDSTADFEHLIAALQTRLDGRPSGFRLWFRGQAEDHLVPDRSGVPDRGFCEYRKVRDTSLVPSLYRSIDSQTETPDGFMKLARHIGDWAADAQVLVPEASSIVDRESGASYTPKPMPKEGAYVRASMAVAGASHAQIPGISDLGPYSIFEVTDSGGRILDTYVKLHHPALAGARKMILLQHYGCKTPWIDITHDAETALWFALHELSLTAPDVYRADRVAAKSVDQSKWPTVYVFVLHPKHHPVVDTAAVLSNSIFQRPQLQKCGLLGGAGSLARNYAARFISLKIRLGRGFAAMRLKRAEDLFPPPAEDTGLARLLEFAATPDNDRLFPVYKVASA